MQSINESIICAGSGGQGILTLGRVLAYAGMMKGLNVTWIPSYGAEVRGGTAYAMVCMSQEAIANPIVSHATSLIIMNGPSLDRFENRLLPNGLLVLNTSLTEKRPKRKDISILELALTDEAVKIGNVRVANMVAIGILFKKKELFTKEIIIAAVEKIFANHKELLTINIRAVERGMELAS